MQKLNKSTYLLLAKVCFVLPRFLPFGIIEVTLAPFSRVKKFIPSKWFLVGINNAVKNRDRAAIIKNNISIYCANKIIAYVGDKVISFYKNKHRYRINNISELIQSIPYPKSEFICISTTHKYTITDNVYGNHYKDRNHLLYLASEILHFAVHMTDQERPAQYEFLDNDTFGNIRYSIQHGDVRWWNAVWKDDEHYSLIDFDAINIYPSLYDFLSLVILDMKTDGLEEFVTGTFDSGILDYLNAHNITESVEEFKDEVLAAFLLSTFKKKHTYEIIKENVPIDYGKTLLAMQNDEEF